MGGNMITFANALALIRETAGGTRECEVQRDLNASVGAILSRDVTSPVDLPAFDNSAMDGFALISSSTIDASPDRPCRLLVGASVAAGEVLSWADGDRENGAVEIMT